MEKFYYLCPMNYKKFLLITEDNMDVVSEFIDWSLKGFTSNYVVINHEMVVIDTLHSLDELKLEFDGLGVEIVESFEKNDKFDLETKILLNEAVKTLDISDDINYFLDLVSDKGSIDLLTGKEKERLFELTKKITPTH